MADLTRLSQSDFSLLDVMPVGVFILRRDFTVHFWNSAMERWTGVNRQDIVGRLVTERYPHLAERKYADRIETIFTGGPPTVFSSLLHKNFIPALFKEGELRTQNAMVTAIEGNTGEPLALFTIQDVTELTSRNSDFRKMRDRALREVEERTELTLQLSAAKERAEAATRLKDTFVSLVAHDLKSPLSSMLVGLRIIVEEDAGHIAPPHAEMLDQIIVNTDRMLKMIGDLLDISRLQSGTLTLRPRFFDAFEPGAVAVNAFFALAKKKKVAMFNDLQPGTRLYGDPNLFGEVINNLVSNALKFTRPGGDVRLFTPPDAPCAIAVRDNGVGVDPDDIDDLFRHEIRTSREGTDHERGNGLGLPYSYDIMKAHGGELSVVSERGAGSLFCAFLPCVRPRILTIGGEQLMRVALPGYFDGLDSDIIEATDVVTAREAVTANPPHIVMLDMDMPGELNGIDLVRHIRSLTADGDIPLIVFTYGGSDANRPVLLAAGANDCLVKPVGRKKFLKVIQKYIPIPYNSGAVT